jgi:hypothetical protein
MIIGAWRSLVAHLHGVQGVGGSNPLAPILRCRLMLNYLPPTWLLFHMLRLSIPDIEQVLREKKSFTLRCMLDGIKELQGRVVTWNRFASSVSIPSA